MRHEHLTVTVEGGTKARIEDDLDGGETVEAWIADAIERKLETIEDDESGEPSGVPGTPSDLDRVAEAGRVRDDGDDPDGTGESYWDAATRDADDSELGGSDGDDSDDDGYEFVDDCGI